MLSFTGQRQGTVSGLYDFPAREYSFTGRWVSPDPAGLAAVDPANPQSWNRYAYVLNNPLNYIDPLGLTTCDKNGNNCHDSVTVTPGNGMPWWFWTYVWYWNRVNRSCGSDWNPCPQNQVQSNTGGGGGNTSDSGNSSGGGDRLSQLLGQDPRLRACIGQANQLFNTQLQNAGINTNVSDQTRNFDLNTAFGLNNGIGRTATTTGFLVGLLRGGTVLKGVQNVILVGGARATYALYQTLSITQYFKDVRQANADFDRQVAACRQAYGN